MRKLFLGFVQLHILHHAAKEPFFGAWMIGELKRHGYEISAGTLYPILHQLAAAGLLNAADRTEGGKKRKFYAITPAGAAVLAAAKIKAAELAGELGD